MITKKDSKNLETFIEAPLVKAQALLQPSKYAPLAKKEVAKTFEKPVVANEIKDAIERKVGKSVVDYLADKMIKLLDASEDTFEPLKEDLVIDGETVYREVYKNGKKALVPEQTPKLDPNGKPYMVHRKKANHKVRKDTLDLARKILVADPPMEKNVNLGFTKDTLNEINEISSITQQLEERDRLVRELEKRIYGDIQDAEFTEET